MLLRQFQVVKFVFEDNARPEQGLLYDGMAGSLLIFTEGYLCQVILTVVRVVGQCVGLCCFWLLGAFCAFWIVWAIWIFLIFRSFRGLLRFRSVST